ncbi:M15 family metallopeptidase [Nonomuraea sp. 3N208]|uniref:M15 family metallopeptidase n=1 Tax=Nonomuraea sp. 3N208 TaxID=3457421 RepID=UPI003FD399BC
MLIGESRTRQKVEQEEDLSWAPTWLISGSSANVTLRLGEVATILLHVAARFHYEIGTLVDGDVVGHRPLGNTRLSAAESNHSSGTAIDIKPGWYPSGAKGGFFPNEKAVIRDILTECEGLVQWGGDSDQALSEGHFQIGVPPGDIRLGQVAEKIQGWNQKPGLGAGRR